MHSIYSVLYMAELDDLVQHMLHSGVFYSSAATGSKDALMIHGNHSVYQNIHNDNKIKHSQLCNSFSNKKMFRKSCQTLNTNNIGIEVCLCRRSPLFGIDSFTQMQQCSLVTLCYEVVVLLHCEWLWHILCLSL